MFKLDFKNLVSKKTEGNNKKNIENLVVFLVLLIITIIAINTIWGSDKKEGNTNNSEYKQLAENIEENSNNLESEAYNLENKLEDILSKMSGVRKS